ncbi:hypothetical protein ACEXOS_009050 [Herbiconiux sp. P16]|uniref:hypothetical protein n=1 Tax=Herbiconiux wuyangfengii TaxID=3342794 RepID=UPI0035BA9DD7
MPDSLDDAFLTRCKAYSTIQRPGQFFSHVTAARLWGIPLPEWTPDEPLHVTTRAPLRAPRVSGVVGHQVEDGSVGAVMRHGLTVADAASTWLRISTHLTEYQLVAAGDYLVRTPRYAATDDGRPFTSIEMLSRRLSGFRGRGRRNALLALPRVRTGVDSPQETRLRLLLVDSGLPEPVTDYELRDPAGGFVAWLDMFYPGIGLAVEYDGQQHRTNDRQYSRDVARIDAIRTLELDIARADKFDLAGTGSNVIAVVTAKTRARGWPGISAT